jgi:transmembrane sensor
MTSSHPFPDDRTIRETAAGWIVRRDRGLSARESIEFELWLATDPRHATAIQRASAAWTLLDHIPESAAVPVLARSTRRRAYGRRFAVAGTLAAAAAVIVAFLIGRQPSPNFASATAIATQVAAKAVEPRQLTLSDGSIVELNRGSEFIEQFSTTERRVTLVRGEGHFTVTHHPARPFIVRAGEVEVRAVGTGFNVNLESAAVEVLVTDGVVAVSPSNEAAARQSALANSVPRLARGQRAVIGFAPTASDKSIVVTTVSQEEIKRTLAWQEPLLRLGGATLAEIAAEFERRSGHRVVIPDAALAQLRFGGRFRADDVEGFAHVLAATLDIEVERAPDGALVLRKNNSTSR